MTDDNIIVTTIGVTVMVVAICVSAYLINNQRVNLELRQSYLEYGLNPLTAKPWVIDDD
jgi:hypothetical protein